MVSLYVASRAAEHASLEGRPEQLEPHSFSRTNFAGSNHVESLLSVPMSVKALYPGTFDPPTNGHMDLIQRGSKLFEHLTVAILNNPVKNPLFTVEERVEMLTKSTSRAGQRLRGHIRRPHRGVCPPAGSQALLRGIRAISDYEHEFQMALMNRRLAPEIETVFLQPAGRYSFISSRMLKEVFSFGGDVTGLVPPTS